MGSVDGSDLQLGQKRGEGPAAMAEGELGLKIDFGHRAVELRKVEERVIPEAAGAARGVQDHSIDGAVGHMSWLSVASGDKHAVIARGALGWRNGIEALKEHDIVPDIGVVICIGRIDQAGVRSEAGGANSRSTGEGVDFESGIIGEDEQSGCELGIIDRFERSVFGEAIAVLFGWVDVLQIGQGVDRDSVRLSRGAKIAQFALAGRSYVEAKGHAMSVSKGGTRVGIGSRE